MLNLKEILESINSIKPHSDSADPSMVTESSLESLKKMGKKIPSHFHYVLDAFEEKDDDKKQDTASKLLELVLYAQGKLKHDNKALSWLASGKVPQSSYDSLTSMGQFRKKCEELFKSYENLKTNRQNHKDIETKIKQDPNNKRLNSKAEKIDTNLDEAEKKYKSKLSDFLDSLESLILGIGSEKL